MHMQEIIENCIHIILQIDDHDNQIYFNIVVLLYSFRGCTNQKQ